jgi:hypothetical protein
VELEPKDWFTVGLASVIAAASYLIKRLIDGKADASDIKAMLKQQDTHAEQLKEHVVSCDLRYKGIADRLDTISEGLGETREAVAKISGKLGL